MSSIGKRGLSRPEQQELWRRWKLGETTVSIAKVLECSKDSLRRVVHRYGGVAPADRTRAASALSVGDREQVSRGLVAGHSFRRIAKDLERAPSTVSREVNRNGGRSAYRAVDADERAWKKACRPKPCRLSLNRKLRYTVAAKLAKRWSPQQIDGWLKQTYPENEDMRMSHETTYKTLFIQARGALNKELTALLRSRRPTRRAKTATRSGFGRGQIVDAVSISERPAEVADRAVPGHWEGDLLSGSGNSHIATLVERHSRFVMLVKVPGKSTNDVVPALTKRIRSLPVELRKSVTWDRGTEMAKHKDFTIATDVQVYFCDPQSPWQRGSNENTNGLLRQYFPKGTDLSQFTQAQLNKVAKELNDRPRQTLGFICPAQKLGQTVALTG
ncbi:MAG: IS30 family transposase [Ahniella sp.]|nr:IS30 family transposase [Ahniella sp.]